jgi:intracellular sulfur oxidation DsrE/DsrF family protein
MIDIIDKIVKEYEIKVVKYADGIRVLSFDSIDNIRIIKDKGIDIVLIKSLERLIDEN